MISSSSGDLQPVFETMLANATRLCEASYGVMWLREGDAFRSAAIHGPLPKAYVQQWRSGTLVRTGPDAPMMVVAQTRQPVQVPDMREVAPISTAIRCRWPRSRLPASGHCSRCRCSRTMR